MAFNPGQSTPVNHKNSIVNSLIEPLALQVLHDVPSENPLFEVFERENVDTAAEVEEILLADANIEAYDSTGATTLTPRDIKLVARYYNAYEHKVFTTTVYENEIRKVTLNPENKNRFVATLVNGLSRARDDYYFEAEKTVLADVVTTYGANLIAGTIDAATAAGQGEQLTEMIRNTIDALMFKNYEFVAHNSSHPTNKFKQKATLEQIRIIVPYKVKNKINVTYLANLYNLEKADLLAKMVTIDTDDGLVYVIDKRSVFRYPQTDELLDQLNAEGAFRNFFLHSNAMLGFSPLFKFAYIDASAMIEEPEEDDETVVV